MDKLIVKLRIPTAGDELRFDCPICQKSFSSGKGLGGHKRVHLLTPPPPPPPNSKSTDHRSSELQTSKEAENSAEKNHPCPICQQAFASEKSVHGHMRKHPDRNWRGMRPPPPQVEVENDDPLPLVSGAVPLLEGSTDHQSGGDKLEAAAERRRRHGKAPMEITPDKESICVAYDLMALANSEPHPKQDFEPKKLKLMELGNSGRPVALGAGSIIGGENSLVVHKKPIRAQKIYVCDICNRPFRTYQALGGHKSHHVLNVRGDHKSAAAHRRAPPPPPPPPVNKVPSCPGGDKENDNQCTVFGFDLNEPPPEETGPGGDLAGC